MTENGRKSSSGAGVQESARLGEGTVTELDTFLEGEEELPLVSLSSPLVFVLLDGSPAGLMRIDGPAIIGLQWQPITASVYQLLS